MHEREFLRFKPHLQQARDCWKKILIPTDTVIDATCGNGKDTAYLAELVFQGRVYSIDIQEQALAKARTVATSFNITFLHQSHATLPQLPSVKLVVYNLGYLPGGDKSITTMTQTTIESLISASKQIVAGGALSITCYPGHLEGALEAKAVAKWVGSLNQVEWQVTHYQWVINSPSLFFLVKLPF